VSPGSIGAVQTEQEALQIARKIGFPVMIKAIAGGGGRGMRPARNEVSLVQGFYAARSEAEKAFGNGGVYIEKLIEQSHHIEFQVLGDSHGRLVQLGERDCSIQRRNQKIIEECPSPFVDEKLRQRMGECSLKLAESVGYENAGTMEYLVDKDGNFYFMEMNTRIQVEHPVTEEVYGCDLVKEQILIAAGEPLSEHVVNAKPRSHAIECRINAEDPDRDFQPSPGVIDLYYAPGGRGVRVDSHVYSKYVIPSYYDSLISKLICVGSTRHSAIRRMSRALSEYLITGIKTTIPFHAKIFRNADFIRGEFDTSFVEKLAGPKALMSSEQ
jgi:acetyl-CoA carboxylase biotin carboxylase subunit